MNASNHNTVMSTNDSPVVSPKHGANAHENLTGLSQQPQPEIYIVE
jgi:hypothetical protein